MRLCARRDIQICRSGWFNGVPQILPATNTKIQRNLKRGSGAAYSWLESIFNGQRAKKNRFCCSLEPNICNVCELKINTVNLASLFIGVIVMQNPITILGTWKLYNEDYSHIKLYVKTTSNNNDFCIKVKCYHLILTKAKFNFVRPSFFWQILRLFWLYAIK